MKNNVKWGEKMSITKRLERLEQLRVSRGEPAEVTFSDGTSVLLALPEVIPLLVKSPDRPAVVGVKANDEPLLRLIQGLIV